jgi:hypothetical protein
LLGASIISGAVFIEVTIRLLFPVTDVAYFTYDPDVGLHLEPNQEGYEVVGAFAEGQGRFRTNSDGWNSVHEYEREKANGTLRLAVIGDSFVESLSVDIQQVFSAVTEERLREEPRCKRFAAIEAYSFGVGGVPMSHYPDLMRYAERNFVPDGFVVLIYPGNDFTQSLLPPNTQSKLPYTVYKATPEGQFDRVSHVPFEPSTLRRSLSKLATVRYLYGNLDLKSLPALKRLGLKHDPMEEAYQAPSETMVAFTDYILGQYKSIAAGKPLLVLTDADRHAIYGEPENTEFKRYVRYARAAASQHQIDYVSLEAVFQKDFEVGGKRFEFPSDDHWNVHANQLVGEAVASWARDAFCLSE